MLATAPGSEGGGCWLTAACGSLTMFSSWTTFAKETWSRWGALSGLGKSLWTPSTLQVSKPLMACSPSCPEGYSFDPVFPPCLGLAALHEAVLSGNLECVKLLVKYGADIHQRDETGWTPLHIACSDGYPDIAR